MLSFLNLANQDNLKDTYVLQSLITVLLLSLSLLLLNFLILLLFLGSLIGFPLLLLNSFGFVIKLLQRIILLLLVLGGLRSLRSGPILLRFPLNYLNLHRRLFRRFSVHVSADSLWRVILGGAILILIEVRLILKPLVLVIRTHFLEFFR